MIPTIAAPNIQVQPPVDASMFTAPSPEPALGRLPLNIVPPPVTNPKVADNPRQSQQSSPREPVTPAPAKGTAAFSLALADGEIPLESPYSTPFVAQLFGQFAMTDGFLDFDQLASMNLIKYRPSLAFRPREAPAAPIEPAAARVPSSAETENEGLQSMMRAVFGANSTLMAPDEVPPRQPATAQPARNRPAETASLFSNGPEAYGATQSRNQQAASQAGARARPEISLVM